MTSLVRYVVVTIVGTLLRMVPWPGKTGLLEIGHPGRGSPVLVTGNFRLTVERVRRALRGLDAYVLVANSRGVNVWCSATGGLLTNHDVLSALKTSGIEERVDHRQVILPQLAATGVEGKALEQKSGWKVVWGPVYAHDLPAFLHSGLTKGTEMREVRFPWTQRLEMAVFWAFPISLIWALIAVLLRRQALVPGVLLVWVLALALYMVYPLYGRWLEPGWRGRGVVFGVLAVLWLVVMLGLVGYARALGPSTWGVTARWGIFTFVVLIVMGIDFLGSTPLYKSGLLEDRLLRVVLDSQRCRGVGYCQEVCPRGCYEVDRTRHTARIARPERCVQCGACIVQCPFDALFFESPDGGVISPDTIRKFKLNMMGKRVEK
jgi:NAD-dependent dihydropyrimidine dehydrogenase PreA subunit